MARRPKRPSFRQSTSDKRLGSTATDRIFRGRIGGSGGSDPSAVHAGDTAGGDLGGTFPNPTVPGLATKQPLHAMLTALVALATVADRGIYFTAPNTPALFIQTAFARTLLDDPDAATARATLGLVIGTDVAAQALSPNAGQKAALAGTTGAPSDTNRFITELGPRDDLPVNNHRVTGLSGGQDSGDATNVLQVLEGDDLARSGFALKRPVFAVSIAALPAHTRTGNTLEATANGTLSSAFGAAAASFTVDSFLLAAGSSGSGNGQFGIPDGRSNIAVDASGNVFVVDAGNNRVQKFNSSGAYVSQFGSGGNGNGQFAGPTGIVIDGSGNLFVLDKANKRVQKFNSSGVYQSQFDAVASGTALSQPSGIAIDGSGNIYVADRGNNRVVKFNSSGVYQSNWTVSQCGDLAVDGSGNVWVTQGGANTVAKYNNAGVFQSSFGSAGSGSGQFNVPSGVEIDGSGNLWVTDAGNNRVQKFNSSGVYLDQFGSTGSGNGQFSSPTAAGLDSTSSNI